MLMCAAVWLVVLVKVVLWSWARCACQGRRAGLTDDGEHRRSGMHPLIDAAGERANYGAASERAALAPAG